MKWNTQTLAMKKSMLCHSVVTSFKLDIKIKINYSVVTFSQVMLKTLIRALDKPIIYIAMVINKNYNSNVLLHE